MLIFYSYSGYSEILGSDEKQNKPVLVGGVRIVALSIGSHEQTHGKQTTT